MSQLRYLLPVLIAALIPACGGDSEEDEPGGSSGSSGSVAQTGGSAGTAGSVPQTGGAGSSSGSSGTAPGTGGSGGGTSGRACDEIAADWTAALAEALSCEIAMSSLQCTEFVDVGLGCACPQALNARHPEAIAEVQALQTEYFQAGCVGPIACGGCMEPQGGGCGPDGECATYGPD